MTKKRVRSLRKCPHIQQKNCPYAHLSKKDKFKCDVCGNMVPVGGSEPQPDQKSSETSND